VRLSCVVVISQIYCCFSPVPVIYFSFSFYRLVPSILVFIYLVLVSVDEKVQFLLIVSVLVSVLPLLVLVLTDITKRTKMTKMYAV